MRANITCISRSLACTTKRTIHAPKVSATRPFVRPHVRNQYIYTGSQRKLHTSRPYLDKPKPDIPTLGPSDAFKKASSLPTQLKTMSLDLSRGKTTTYETLHTTDIEAPHTGYIRILSLNRPEARNAISKQLLKELDEQVEVIHAQGPTGDVRVLIVASEVDSSFCAGADLKERRGMSKDEVHTFLTSLRSTFSRLSTLPIPSISSISGTALGGGLELALCTHFRVLSSNAVLGLPETRLAIIPGAGGTYRLPAIVGLSAALDLILTGRRIGMAEAARIGLGIGMEDGVVADEEAELDPSSKRLVALARSLAVARQISEGAPLAIAAAMRALLDGPRGEVAENVAYDSLLASKDRVEALVAFGEKRKPRFSGE